MFKLFKRTKKPECYGDRFKLSVECHKCEIKSNCLDYINSRSCGTYILPTNKPIPKPPRIPLSSKEPPKPNWTLESAQEDFIKENKTCKNCKFMKCDWFPVTEYKDKDVMVCKVKGCEITNKDAEECKYYKVD